MKTRLPFRLLASIVFVSPAFPLVAQTPGGEAARPSFEVASVRPNKTGDENASVRIQPGGRLTATNQTVRNLIRNAYNIQMFQFVGGPPWIDDERYDIVAKVPDSDLDANGRPDPERVLLKLQALLADRFKLVVRREKRELPIFALMLARPDGKPGPQFRPAAIDCAALARSNTPPPPPSGDRPSCGLRMTQGKIMGSSVPMEQLARNMSTLVKRVVVDQTGLTGAYDLDLAFVLDPTADSTGPSIFTALQEQLGLKLESTRGPIDALVIESVERPAPD